MWLQGQIGPQHFLQMWATVSFVSLLACLIGLTVIAAGSC